MLVWNMTKVVVLLVQGMLSIIWWKWENCLTIVIICLPTIYLQPMQQQIICWNEALLWLEQWYKISYSIYQTKLLLLSQRLKKKFITGEIPCHVILAKAISKQACYYAINYLWGISGFDKYHNVIAHHTRPRMCAKILLYVTYEGKYQKAYIKPQTVYLVIFQTIFPKLILI